MVPYVFDLVVECNKESGYFTGAENAVTRHELLLSCFSEQSPIIKAEVSHVATANGIGSVRAMRSKRQQQPGDEGCPA